jgi:hypothetical protein
LTNRARLAIILDVLPNARPPIVPPNILGSFLWTEVPEHFMHLGNYDLGHLSFLSDEGWYAQYRFACFIASIQEILFDLKILVVPNILEYL